MHNLAEEIKAIWAIKIIIRTILFTSGAFLFEYLLPEVAEKLFFFDYLFPIVIFFLGVSLVIFWPKKYYKSWKFDIRENEIYLERGVFTKICTTAPFKRIQHLDVEQSIMDRMFGLGKLVIYTAGTRGADLLIPGLPIQYAEDLRDSLKNIANEDAV